MVWKGAVICKQSQDIGSGATKLILSYSKLVKDSCFDWNTGSKCGCGCELT